MKDIILQDGNVFSVPDEQYEFVSDYIKRISGIEWILEAYACVNPDKTDEDDYVVFVFVVVNDCSDKWIERVNNRIGMYNSTVLATVVMRSEVEKGIPVIAHKEDLLVKVHDSTWYGFSGDIPRCGMASLQLVNGTSVCVSEYFLDRIKERVDAFRQLPGIGRIVLFGSCVHDWCTNESDIDILLIYNGKEFIGAYQNLFNTRGELFFGDTLYCTEDEYAAARFGVLCEARKKGVVVYDSMWRCS